jgi:hypothetical protein
MAASLSAQEHSIQDGVKPGEGCPELSADELVIPLYHVDGWKPVEMNDWTFSSGYEARSLQRETGVTANGGIDFGAAFEMTFRRGKLKLWRDLQLGVKTADPRSWTGFDQVWHAFSTQLSHLARYAMVRQYVALERNARFALPAGRVLRDAPLVHRRERQSQGDSIETVIERSCLDAVGKATAIDGLAAVKHLVFDTESLTWDALLDAIGNDWDGDEPTRQLWSNAPKYGTGIAWVDQLAREMDRVLLALLHEHPKSHRTEGQAA